MPFPPRWERRVCHMGRHEMLQTVYQEEDMLYIM